MLQKQKGYSIIKKLKSRIKNKGIKIAFPESCEQRTLAAVEIICREKIAVPVLIGSAVKIKAAAKKLRTNLSGAHIIDTDTVRKETYINRLFELRKEKGMTLEDARKVISEEEIYLATLMLELGEVDGLISGAVHPTSHTLRPAFQVIKTMPGISAASGAFLMIRSKKGFGGLSEKREKSKAKEEAFIFADCGVIPYPTSEQLADIAISSAKSTKQFGLKPKVAMLSFSTMGSAEHESVKKVREAVKLAQQKILGMPDASDIIIDGELQADAALVKEVAVLKCPNSRIKGDANVLIFPNLDAGNIGYKLVQRLGNFEAIGPIVQGLKKPVNDLSRGCSVNEIVDMAVITAVQALSVKTDSKSK